MVDLLATLAPISLVDSLSLMPFALVVLATLLSGPRPYVASMSFLAGIATSYFAAGVLIAVGLGGVIARVTAGVAHWYKNPAAIDYVLGMLIGLALIVLGYRWATARRQRAERKSAAAGMTPAQAFLLGAGATLAGLWGALPYFAAVDQILKAGISTGQGILALAYYNAIFVAIPLGLVVARAFLGRRGDDLLATVNRLLSIWGKRLLVAGMILLGAVMIADGVGWLLGRPLIPVG